MKRPIRVMGDGNCLFNSVSVALFGSESASMRLRYFTAIELGVNQESLKKEFISKKFHYVTEDFEEACKNVCTVGGFSCAWTLMALCNVIKREIVCLYPRINGPFDEVAKILDTTFTPSEVKSKSKVYIMWTSSFTPVLGRTWLPNHFVPLENVNGEQFVD